MIFRRLIQTGAALMGLAILVSLLVTPDIGAGLPWVIFGECGVALVLMASGPARGKIAHRGLAVFLVCFAYFLLLGTLFTTHWPDYKLSWLSAVYAALPSVRSLPVPLLSNGLEPNQMGGVIAACAGFAFALAIGRRPVAPDGDWRRRLRIGCMPLAALGPIVVFMTGSRAALAGLAVALVLVLVGRDRHWLWLPASASVATLWAWVLRPQLVKSVASLLLHEETVTTKVVARLDIWASAIRGIEDHAFTGIGLGVFNQVIPARYPYETVALSYSVSQAHNIFLDTALSIGLPGLLGLVLLLAGMIGLARDGISSGGKDRNLYVGLAAVIAVFMIFGISDSFNLSNPSSLILWLVAAGLAVLPNGKVNSTL